MCFFINIFKFLSIIFNKLKNFFTQTGLTRIIYNIKKNKQLNVIKVVPEELCDSNFIQTEETGTTCCNSKSSEKSEKYCDMLTGKFYTSFYTLMFLKIVKNVFKTDITASSSSNIASNVGHNVKIKTKSDELYFDGENSNTSNKNLIKVEGEKLLYVKYNECKIQNLCVLCILN